MRIAFLTPEFPTRSPFSGGLSSHLGNLTQALLERGDVPEVFVIAKGAEGTETWRDVRVQHVDARAAARRGPARVLRRLWGKRAGSGGREAIEWLAGAHALARALEARHEVAPFAAVQSSDYHATGLFVAKRGDRVRAVRCSGAADLWAEVDGATREWGRYQLLLERAAIRRADVAFAPSAYVARINSERCGRPISVLRPPVPVGTQTSPAPPDELPPRFLFHFGILGRRKGTETLARALPLAWSNEPELTMVWAGRSLDAVRIDALYAGLGENAARVVRLGSLAKPDLRAVLLRARASVLPSLVDNLPNTVIESLAAGIPVVGTRGSSIDELVDEGKTGWLLPPDDPEALARALVGAWRGEGPQPGFSWDAPIAREMEPARAAEALVELLQPGAPGAASSQGRAPDGA